MSTQNDGYEWLVCPFCKDKDFDDVGLKLHLAAGHCDVFNAVDISPPFTKKPADALLLSRERRAERNMNKPPHVKVDNGVLQNWHEFELWAMANSPLWRGVRHYSAIGACGYEDATKLIGYQLLIENSKLEKSLNEIAMASRYRT